MARREHKHKPNKPTNPELSLLHPEDSSSSSSSSSGVLGQASDHSLRTAPILSGDAASLLGPDLVPQRAVYGRILGQVIDGDEQGAPVQPQVYINSNAPFSAVVCGLQGSGKSHSTSVLLESCLIQDERLGTLPAPLSAVLFHFDSAAGGGQVQPCEAAYLASLVPSRAGRAVAPDVTVLVLPNNINTMRRVYEPLPNVKVEPLHFAAKDISGERLLAMMKVDENSQMPLYMELIMTILRDMTDDFDYTAFRAMLAQQKFAPTQKAMLNLRLALLDSCLKGGSDENSVSTHFRSGGLTIIDLSSPFMDPSSACGFFDIILGLFLEAKVDTGKLIVLDEAHKYLSDTGASARLTDSLLTTIRQQRHLNTRVLISTQEPTVVPSKFLELSSFIIAHRFSSPQWLRHLSAHVSAAQERQDELFSKVVGLQTGQAIIFAPSGLGVKNITIFPGAWEAYSAASLQARGVVTPFGQGYLLVRSRQRITLDGGHSLLAVAGSVPTEGTTSVDEDDEDASSDSDEEDTSDDGDASDASELDIPGNMTVRIANEELSLVRSGQRRITHDGGQSLLAVTNTSANVTNVPNGIPPILAIEGPPSIVQDEEHTSNDGDGSDTSESDVQSGSVPNGIIANEEHQWQDPEFEVVEGEEGEEDEEHGSVEDISSDSGFETCVDEDEDRDEDEEEDTPVAETASMVEAAAVASPVQSLAVMGTTVDESSVQAMTVVERTVEETPVQVRTDLARTVEVMGSSSSSEPVVDPVLVPVVKEENPFDIPSFSSSAEKPASTPIISTQALLQFSPLIKALKQAHSEGQDRVNWTTAAIMSRKCDRGAFLGRFLDYMQEAAEAGIVEYGGRPEASTDWVRLTRTDPSPPLSPPPPPQPRTVEQVHTDVASIVQESPVQAATVLAKTVQASPIVDKMAEEGPAQLGINVASTVQERPVQAKTARQIEKSPADARTDEAMGSSSSIEPVEDRVPVSVPNGHISPDVPSSSSSTGQVIGGSSLSKSVENRAPVLKDDKPSSIPSSSSSAENPTSIPTISAEALLRFSPLIKALRQAHSEGKDRVDWSTAAIMTRKISNTAYSGKFSVYMKEAAAAGIIEYGGDGYSHTDWVRLTRTAMSPPPATLPTSSPPQPRAVEQEQVRSTRTALSPPPLPPLPTSPLPPQRAVKQVQVPLVGQVGGSSRSTPATSNPRPDLLRFNRLVEILKKAREQGSSSLSWSVCEQLMKVPSGPPAYPSGLFSPYLQDAKRAGIIEFGGNYNTSNNWVRLIHSELSSMPPRNVEDEFAPLLRALREQKAAGMNGSNWSDTASMVKTQNPSAYTSGMFVYYVEAAVKAGVVVSGGSGMGKWIRLVEPGVAT